MSQVNEKIYDAIDTISTELIREKIKFTFAGSVSTLLQGCELVPGDIDILVFYPKDVKKISQLFHKSLLDEDMTVETSSDKWLASKNKTYIEFRDTWNNGWTFSRFIINGVKIEITNIQVNKQVEYVGGTGMWEWSSHLVTH